MVDRTTKRQPLPPPTREETSRFAIASTVMEGQSVSEDTERLLAEWASGAMTDDDLMRRAMEPEATFVSAARLAPGE